MVLKAQSATPAVGREGRLRLGIPSASAPGYCNQRRGGYSPEEELAGQRI